MLSSLAASAWHLDLEQNLRVGVVVAVRVGSTRTIVTGAVVVTLIHSD